MTCHDSRLFLRNQLVKDISQLVCKPCTDFRKKDLSLVFDDPVACSCRCKTVEPLIERLIKLETELGLR